MKRFALVALLAAMFFGVTAASAGELKVRAGMDVYGQWSQNLVDLDSNQSDNDNNVMAQRARMYFDYISNENLKMVVGFEMDQDWGGANAAGFSSDQTGQIELKHAYLDFTLPDTTVNVKAGLLPVALPGVFKSPIFDEDAHAIVVSSPITDMFAVTAGYMRLRDNQRDHSTPVLNGTNVNGDEFDAAFLAAPITLDGAAITPYFTYAWLGSDFVTGGNAKDMPHWWLGANAVLTMFDPFKLEADLIYGASSNDNNDSLETEGWFGAIAASYKMDMVTPKLFFTYGTGNDEDVTDGGERMPVVREDFKFSPNTGLRAFSTTYNSWATTRLGAFNGSGMWALGLQLSKIKFIDNLTHDLTIAYMQGTDDYETKAANGVRTPRNTFTEKDSAWEVHFITKYQIFEQLAAIAELGYFSPDLKDRIAGPGSTPDDASAFFATGFEYKF